MTTSEISNLKCQISKDTRPADTSSGRESEPVGSAHRPTGPFPGEFAPLMRQTLVGSDDLPETRCAGPKPGLPRSSRTSSGSASSSDALTPNVILLPLPTGVIPFPVAVAADGGGSTFAGDTPDLKILSFTAAQPLNQSLDEAEENGIDVSRLAMLPAEADEPMADNIKVIDFRQPAEAKIIRLPVPSWANPPAQSGSEKDSAQPDAAQPLGEFALTQLPVAEEPSEEIAQLAATDNPGERLVADSEGLKKAVAHAGLSRIQMPPAGSVEATGITAARQEMRMDSLKHSEQGSAFAGRGQNGSEEFPPLSNESSRAEVKVVDFSLRNSGAMDWQLGRPADSFDRPAPVLATPLTPEQSAMVDRISNLMIREISLVRQYSSDSMAVVLRPDDNTELYVHFARRSGQIEATVRCDRGDVRQLGTLWPQLQESLARQRVRLAPLQEGPSAHSGSRHAASSGSCGDGGGSRRHSPADRQFMDERSAPASSIPDVSHFKGRGGSRRRLTTSRPGWETWA